MSFRSYINTEMFINPFLQFKNMRKAFSSLAKKVVPAVALGASYAFNPGSADAQQNPRNVIYSDNPRISVTGRGYTATDHCFDTGLGSDSRIDVERRFSLRDSLGIGLSYDAVSGRTGAGYELGSLRRTSPLSPKDRASIAYLENLIREMPDNKPEDVALFRRAVRPNGIIDSREDSLFVNGAPKLEWGPYSVIVHSPQVKRNGTDYEAQSVNICLNLIPEATKRPGLTEVPTMPEPARQPEDYVPRGRQRDPEPRPRVPKKEKTNRPRLFAGVETGTEEDLRVAGALNIPVTNGIGLEVFGNYVFSQGQPYFTSESEEVTFRERQQIGEKTFKERKDILKTLTEEQPTWEAGAGLTFRVANGKVEFPLRVGAQVMDITRNIEGKSIIRHERETDRKGEYELLEPESVISKPKTETSNRILPTLEAGVRFTPLDMIYIESGFKITGVEKDSRKNQVNAGIGIRF